MKTPILSGLRGAIGAHARDAGNGISAPQPGSTNLPCQFVNDQGAGNLRHALTPVAILLWITISATQAQSPLPDSFNPGADNWVSTLAVQADGKILVGGGFRTLGGQPRNYIARLNADGSLDTGFNPGASNPVYSLAVQADGKILVGGSFSVLGGRSRNQIARLNADGTLDDGLYPGAGDPPYSAVYSLAVQADGRILVGGYFTTLGGQAHNGLGRFNADGSLDTTFNPGANGSVYTLSVQPDGKILVGGEFSTLGGQPRNHVARLNADGTLDSEFNPGADRYVRSVSVQADGKILVGGWFTTLGGQPRNALARLNADGTLDSGFNPAPHWDVSSLAVQTDGKILVGGSFNMLGGQPRTNLARLNADGSLDSTFNPGASSSVDSLAVQADGKILVGGWFTTLGPEGLERNHIGRLNNTEAATQSLGFDGSTITWLRGGTSPEVWRTGFDVFTNGIEWTPLSEGSRISGGWQLTGLSLPAEITLRARGYVSGSDNACGWFVETYDGRPGLVAQPVSRTNDAGTTATFSVVVVGAEPLSFDWLKEGMPLVSASNIAGTATASLILTNVLGGNSGRYSVVVSNGFGAVTSAVASLTVVEPVITVQPVSRDGEAGQNVTLSVMALGTTPLGYQWWKEEAPVPGATGASLILSNLQAGDPGNYRVVVTNQYGSVTSAVARLRVNLATLDRSFNPRAEGQVYALAMQADGKILVGGHLIMLGGQMSSYVGRLNADGTLDNAFDPRVYDDVYSLAVQPDGKVLLGGAFTTVAGQWRYALARLNANGTLESGFNPRPEGFVYAVAVQADGKILVGGNFSRLSEQRRNGIARLNPDGSLDSGFNPGAGGAFAYVYSVAVQADGRILVGGNFTQMGGQPRNRIARLNADGTLDAGFDPGANDSVELLTEQADGKILVAGQFSTLAGQLRGRIARLNPDGTLDSGFNPGPNGNVSSLVEQADGKILVGGGFSTMNGQPRNCLARLNPDGTLDGGFHPAANSAVYALALQADGKILVGGDFSELGGQRRRKLGRLNNTEPATQSLSYEDSTITWLRGGTSPEVSRTSFDVSTNASDWTRVGEGSRIAGGWRLAGTSLPLDGILRARGYVSGSYRNKSGYFVEAYYGRPLFLVQPVSQTNDAATTATFGVVADGTEPLSFQWLKDGMPLVDGGSISGTTTPLLTLTNLLGGETGGYSVVVSNQYGSATSTVAVLTVHIIATADMGFNPGVGGAYSFVSSLAVQADGKILVGGSFTNLGGQPRNNLGRLNADGSLDDDFNPGASSYVYSLLVQADGKILVGGHFMTLSGQPRTYFGRLNPDGSLDSGFEPRADWDVIALAADADGKIVVGGSFTRLFGWPRDRIARLNADGTLDRGFRPGVNGGVSALAMQPGGKVLVGGRFTMMGGQPRTNLARLNRDGTLDNGFNPGADLYTEFASVSSLVVQADGKILVGGGFYTLGGQQRRGIGRLNVDGSLDSGFNPGASHIVNALALQADGKILVGGGFTALAGQSRTNLARLNADGTLDNDFDPRADSAVYSMAVQPDGKVLVGGAFTSLSGQPRNRLARLNNTEPATQSLSYNGSRITWLRSGTSPEVWRTSFDVSGNGGDWTPLGEVSRIPGGWELAGVSLPPEGTLRARGYVAGSDNASGWFVETLAQGPWPLWLNVVREASDFVLNWTGGRGPYQVQQTTNLSNTNSWENVGEPSNTNSMKLPLGPGNLFLRVRGQ